MINDFKSTLGKRGFARPTMFRVEITSIPPKMNNVQGINEIMKDLHFFAETAEFPGTQILTQEIRYYDMSEKYAYGKAHDELNIIFRLDRDFQIKRFFDTWINSIYDRETGDVSFKTLYSGSLQIYQIMENGTSSYAVELEQVFPTQIGQISLGWDQTGTYSRLPITFTFKRMRIIANKEIFRRTESSSTSPKLNSLDQSKTNILSPERTISEPLTNMKTELTSILNNSNLNEYRQISVMNKTYLGGMFNGFGFI